MFSIPTTPMPYRRFIASSQACQRNHCRDELRRIQKAKRLWLAYQGKMAAIGLHALDRKEIEDRKDQLETMLATVTETHADGPVMRFSYESFMAAIPR